MAMALPRLIGRRAPVLSVDVPFAHLLTPAPGVRPGGQPAAPQDSYDRKPAAPEHDEPMSADMTQPRHPIVRRWRAALLLFALPTVFGAILWVANAVGDSNRVPAEIAASARDTGVMLCAEGTVDHDDESLWDRITSVGTFRCTSWRMRGKASSTTTGAVDWPSSPRR